MKAIPDVRAYRVLLFRLVARQLAQRYRTSVFGFAWAVLQPLLLLLAYWFLFGLVFRSRWPDDSGVPLHAILFSGLIVANFFSECLNQGVGSIVANPNYVKRVVFPLEIQSLALCITAFVHLLINMAILAAFLLVGGSDLPWVFLLMPLAMLPLLLLAVGLVWMLSALAVYVRDLNHVVPLATSLLLFFAPVFYPLSLLPEGVRAAMWLNPLTPAVELMHAAIGLPLSGELGWLLAGYVSAAAIGLLLGGWVFSRLRGGFADVL